ncbi:uncharacterized protein LOC131620202 [Vicia villosa]|uniref:uncharacterized protein LOC131620202 n=1 Tax=Vicia villosa TaxID=3911 RepID=UPI00273C0BEE|nr:uncharacterized protein LOC131620202 [Vicia villosa]
MSGSNVDEIPQGTLSTTDPIVSQVATLPSLTNESTMISTTGALVTSIPLPPPGSPGSTMTTTIPFRPNIPRFGTANPLHGIPNNQNRVVSLSNTSIAVLRQQMDYSNHELVNMLANQMGTVPQVNRQNVAAQAELDVVEEETLHQEQNPRPQQNQGVGLGHQPVTELPRGMKVPKYTKFGGESGESTIEHITRYLIESGDLAHNENLRISLAELSGIKRRFAESIDDYLNRFRSLKARCLTQVPEHELVQMATGGLDYSIRKKIDPTFVKNPIYEADYASPTEVKVDVAEMKPGSAYECRSLLPAQGKNPVENNPKFPSKTYTFDVTKCEEIFDVLVKDGQMGSCSEINPRRKAEVCWSQDEDRRGSSSLGRSFVR